MVRAVPHQCNAHISTLTEPFDTHRDTVSSIGLFRGKLLPLTDKCDHIKFFRHALALDECRVKFLPEYVTSRPNNDQHIKEVWFAGTHSDMSVFHAHTVQI